MGHLAEVHADMTGIILSFWQKAFVICVIICFTEFCKTLYAKHYYAQKAWGLTDRSAQQHFV